MSLSAKGCRPCGASSRACSRSSRWAGTAARAAAARTRRRSSTSPARPVALPVTGDALGITYEGRSYGVFAPDGTKFEQGADGIVGDVRRQEPRSSWSARCRRRKTSPRSHQHAFAVPRDTQLSWNYDRNAGTITTTWKVIAEPLKGAAQERHPRLAAASLAREHEPRSPSTASRYTDHPRADEVRGGRGVHARAIPSTASCRICPAPKAAGYDGAAREGTARAALHRPEEEPRRPTPIGAAKTSSVTPRRRSSPRRPKTRRSTPIARQARDRAGELVHLHAGREGAVLRLLSAPQGPRRVQRLLRLRALHRPPFPLRLLRLSAGLVEPVAAGLRRRSMATWPGWSPRNMPTTTAATRRFPFFRTFDIWRGH